MFGFEPVARSLDFLLAPENCPQMEHSRSDGKMPPPVKSLWTGQESASLHHLACVSRRDAAGRLGGSTRSTMCPESPAANTRSWSWLWGENTEGGELLLSVVSILASVMTVASKMAQDGA